MATHLGECWMKSSIRKEIDVDINDTFYLVKTEQGFIRDKLEAFDRFVVGVNQISTDSNFKNTTSNINSECGHQSLSVVTNNTANKDNQIKKVRTLFAETVCPHSLEDIEQNEPLLVTIREELGEEIALALSPLTSQRFTNNLKTAILSSSKQSQYKLKAMNKGLDVEKKSLENLISLTDSFNKWSNSKNQPIEEKGFISLKNRHEKLSDFREKFEELTVQRQSIIHSTTNSVFSANMSHDVLVNYLYQSLPVNYPVLSVSMQLINLCDNQQRTVREYLTRCV